MRHHLNIASLTGRVRNMRFNSEENIYEFYVKFDKNLFHIKARGPVLMATCKTLQDGEMIYVLSRPNTTFFRRCRRDHVHFEAVTILPMIDTPDPEFEKTLQAIVIEATRGHFDNE